MSILLVEDDVSLASGLTEALRGEGFAINHVDTGAAALHVIGTEPPDVVILDLGLPDIDGLQVPVQVFWGDQDAFLGSENARLLHQRLPHSRLTIFENCGHFCYQDKVEDFTQMLREWIQGGYRAV